MKMLICHRCGGFVTTVKDGKRWVPMKDRCPACDGTEFKDTDSGRTMDTGAGQHS